MRSRLILALFAFVASLFAGEFVLIPWVSHLPRETFLMGFAATPGMVDDVLVNSTGFTGDVIEPRKPTGTTRILTLGESSLFNRRMTERIKSRLQSISKTKLEIVGAALRTHTTRSSLLKYRLLRRYDFDFVLIYHGINDLWADHVPLRDFREDYSHVGLWYRRNLWLDHCAVCRVAYNALATAPVPAPEGPSHFAALRTFERNLSSLIDSIRHDGATPVLMTLAWNLPPNYSYQAFTANRIGYNNPTNYDRWPVELWGPPDFVRKGLELHNRVVRRLAERHRVPLLDQEHLMGLDLRWFGDVCHLSEEGTDRFIENIAGLFAREGWLQ
jgi:hypothetical protein